MLSQKINARPCVCALPLVYGIIILQFTFPLAYSDDLNRQSVKHENANEPQHRQTFDHLWKRDNPTSEEHKNDTAYKSKIDSTLLSNTSIIARRTAEFKELLLKKLGLPEESLLLDRSKYNMTLDVSKIPPGALEGTRKDNAREEAMEKFYAHEEQVMIPGRDLGDYCIASKNVTGCYLFDLAGKIRGNVVSAQIWFYKTPDANDGGEQRLRVMEVTKNNRAKSRSGHNQKQRADLVPRVVMVRHNTRIREGWISVNINSRRTERIKKKKKLMIAIQCNTCSHRHHKSLYGYENGYKPLLVLNYETSTKISRKRRRADDDCDPKTDCCKKQLELNFDRLGLQAIMEPRSLQIGYCHGSCRNRLRFQYEYSTFSYVLRHGDPNLDDETKKTIEPCCVPVEFSAINLLYHVHNDTWYKQHVPNTIVVGCGCV